MKIMIPPTPPISIEVEITQPNELMRRGQRFTLKGCWLAYAAEIVDPDMVGNGTLIYIPNALPGEIIPNIHH